MAKKRRRDEADEADDTKPLVDALDDALTAVLEVVRSLRRRAASDGEKAGERIRRAASGARRTAKSRLSRAWDVLVHGDESEDGGR
jgi:hypothetical protein